MVGLVVGVRHGASLVRWWAPPCLIPNCDQLITVGKQILERSSPQCRLLHAELLAPLGARRDEAIGGPYWLESTSRPFTLPIDVPLSAEALAGPALRVRLPSIECCPDSTVQQRSRATTHTTVHVDNLLSGAKTGRCWACKKQVIAGPSHRVSGPGRGVSAIALAENGSAELPNDGGCRPAGGLPALAVGDGHVDAGVAVGDAKAAAVAG